MSDLLVSVIIPTYNRSQTICKSIESVLNQTYRNLEVIVVDDGSTDNTCDKLIPYKGNLTVIQQNNAGPSAARNKGIAIAKGEIIAFLDSDDLWLPTKIEKQVNILKRVDKSVPCCLCNAIICNSISKKRLSFELAPINPKYDEGVWMNVTQILSTRCIFFTQAAAIRREVLHKVGGFDGELWLMEDYDLALKLSLEGPWAIIREPLVVYHQRATDSLSSDAKKYPSRIHENVERILINILADDRIDNDKTRRQFAHNLWRTRLYIWMAHKNHKYILREIPLTRLLKLLMYVQETIFRHSPWFPRMEVVPLSLNLRP